MNDYEQMVEHLTDEFVEMVHSLVDVIAPSGPWWSEQASLEAQVLRWLEIREPAMRWLAAAEPYGPWKSSDGPGTKYQKLFKHPDPFRIIPAELLLAIPKEVKQAFRYAGMQQAAAWMDRAENAAGPVARAIIGKMAPAAPDRLPEGVILRPGQTGGDAIPAGS